MPDYKLPTVVYSENYLPKEESMQNVEMYYSRNDNSLVADEKKIYKDIIENNTFEFFANSLLVECTDSDDVGNIYFASICDDRIAEYQLGTKIYADAEVRKYAFVEDGELMWYDQEWMLENIPADYIIFRSLGTVYFSYRDLNDIIPMEWLIKKCGLDKAWNDFVRLETFFSASIRDELHINESATFKKVDETTYVNNIKKLWIDKNEI